MINAIDQQNNNQAVQLIVGSMQTIFQAGTKTVSFIKPHECIQMYIYEIVHVDNSKRKINIVCMGISTNSSQLILSHYTSWYKYKST